MTSQHRKLEATLLEINNLLAEIAASGHTQTYGAEARLLKRKYEIEATLNCKG